MLVRPGLSGIIGGVIINLMYYTVTFISLIDSGKSTAAFTLVSLVQGLSCVAIAILNLYIQLSLILS